MENWRPDNWENGKVMRSWGKLTLEGEYEAGADAMLEALRDARFPYTQGQFAGIDITKEGDFLIILKS